MKNVARLAVCTITSLIWATIPAAKGSAEGDAPFELTEAKLSTLFAGYSFTLKLDEKCGLQSLVATYKGKEFNAPKGELPELKEVDLRAVRLKATGPDSAGPLEEIVVIIPYSPELRKDPDFGKRPEDQNDQTSQERDKMRVSNVIRVLFLKGKFVRWERAISLGEDSHAWRLSYKDAGHPEEDNGKEECLGNPYWHGKGMGYWDGALRP